MTDKEFRHLSRADLVEIIYELQKSERNLQAEIDKLNQKLEDRRIAISESGSLAEVTAKLNGLFDAAQATADDYRKEAEQLLEYARQTKAQADEYMSNAKKQAEKIARLTVQQRKSMLTKTAEECKKMLEASQPKRITTQQNSISHPIKEGRFNGNSKE